jgi:hypothetical protein
MDGKTKQTIQIKSAELKESSGGKPFVSVETSNGKASCWDNSLFDELLSSKTIEAYIHKNDKGYVNIYPRPFTDKKGGYSKPSYDNNDIKEILSIVKEIKSSILGTEINKDNIPF